MRIGLDISVLNEPRRTGISVYVYQLVKAMIKARPTDEFVLFGLAPLAMFDYMTNLDFKNYPNVRMKVFKLPARLFRRVFLLWQWFNWPPIEYLIGQVDVFHSFNWFVPPQKNGKVVATVFDLTAVKYPQWHHPRTTQLDQVRFRRIAKMADLVVTISQFSKQDFVQLNGSKSTIVIYPGVGQQYNKKYRRVQLQRVLNKYGLNEGYVLSVGTLEPRKNVEALIKAYLRTKISQPLVVVGGMGWKNDRLGPLLNKSRKRVVMLGFVDELDLPLLYLGAVCLVYPSLYEGFGIPVLEAMKMGVPVITSSVTSLPEVGGGAVEYINPQNGTQMTRALEKVFFNSTLRHRMSNKGVQQAKRFSWQRSAKEMLEAYQRICQ